MTKNPTVQVERVLPAVGNFSVREADAILRSMASGGKSTVSDGALNKLFERYAERIDHAARTERLEALRADLARDEARELAYKVAYAMSLCDLETSDEEVEFDEELIVALGLSDERADALAGEVYAALDEDTDAKEVTS